MEVPASRIAQLITKYLNNELDEKDSKELFDWTSSIELNKTLFDKLTDEEWLLKEVHESDEIETRIFQRIAAQLPEVENINTGKIYSLKARIIRISVAAAVVVLLSMIVGYFWIGSKKENSLVHTGVNHNDKNPGKVGAVLTLSSGQEIVLDSTATGKLAQQGKTVVLNEKSKLVYNGNKEDANKNIFNVLTTNKGQIYSTILSDGTIAWLNSASSLRYPVTFNNKERKVELTGEAFFQVTHGTTPFIVSTGEAVIEVLGTEFNVNAYADEPIKRTTLLNGKVKIRSIGSGQVVTLSPNQKAEINKNGEMRAFADADAQQAVAWKDGYFQFKNEDIQTVMRQISRWYNLDIVYEGAIPVKYFGGKLPRNAKVSVILRVLEKNKVHFRIEGQKIVVMP